jgi:hypothetical protein
MDRDESALADVGEQDLDDAEREIQVGGDVSDRGGETAQPQ